MIYVGLDDTDLLNHPGTNQLARHIAGELRGDYDCRLVLRHQLLIDPRVPCTNKNGCAAMLLEPRNSGGIEDLVPRLRRMILDWAPHGSDPGLCLANDVPRPIVAWGWRCKQELVTQADARSLAREHDIHLEGLGGDEGGVIGALAAIGLASTGDDGRVVHIGSLEGGDLLDCEGIQPVQSILAHGVSDIRCVHSLNRVRSGNIDLGKRLRPNYRAGRVVLFVTPIESSKINGEPQWQAVRVP